MATHTVLNGTPRTEWSRARTEAAATTAISDTVTAASDGFVQNFSWLQQSGDTVTLTYNPGGDTDHGVVIVNAATAITGNDAGGWSVTAGDTFTVAMTGTVSGDRSYTMDFGGRVNA